MGHPRVGDHAPADPGGAGRPPLPRGVERLPDRGRRARRRPPATCCGCGAASATTGARVRLHAAAGAVVAATSAGASPDDRWSCSACRASGRTRPGPCWPSPSRPMSPSSTPTSLGPGPLVAAARCGPAEVQALADAAAAGGPGLGLEPVPARPRRHRLPRPADRSAGPVRWAAVVRVVGGRDARRPIPRSGSAHTGRPQSPFVGSDRQGRGRLVRALGRGPIRRATCLARPWAGPTTRPARRGWPPVVVADGLAVRRADGEYRLP